VAAGDPARLRIVGQRDHQRLLVLKSDVRSPVSENTSDLRPPTLANYEHPLVLPQDMQR
jgi:hypothetical protein